MRAAREEIPRRACVGVDVAVGRVLRVYLALLVRERLLVAHVAEEIALFFG
jgi:hypothetical protein